MNIFEFSSILSNPHSVTPGHTAAIEDMLETYPYFQAAHILYLKGLKDQQSYKYNNALKTAAAYTANRSVLFDFITLNTLDIEENDHQEKQFITESEVVDPEVIDKVVTANKELRQKVIEESVKTAEEQLEIGKPLVFDVSEMHSFYEWLQLTSATPIVREEAPQTIESTEGRDEKFKMIDEFIRNKPKLKPPVEMGDAADFSVESTTENESLMTETLARVYLEQKKYDKAIQAFKILSLKFPEKSGFFADRIKAVQFLQKNNS